MALSGYARVELMGHIERIGRISEVEFAGSRLAQLDVINGDGEVTHTEYFGGTAVYRITPLSEEVAREAAGRYPHGDRRPEKPMDWRPEKALPPPEKKCCDWRDMTVDEQGDSLNEDHGQEL